MFRLWGKIIRSNKTLKDTVIEDGSSETRTHKVMNGLSEICYRFDLSVPAWFDSNIREFQRHRKTRFKQDNFIESVDFDYLEISVLEEDGF